jgi:hypothetical protein
MAEGCDAQAIVALDGLDDGEQLGHAAARNDNVVVQLEKACRPQGQ